MPKQPGKHTTVYNIPWSTLLQSQLQACTSCVYGHRYHPRIGNASRETGNWNISFWSWHPEVLHGISFSV